MTDELTPEEKEALKKLPRERMPSAGLEERVVGALRERGVLSRQRRRSIEITNSRVAGVLAACIALVIGAYSIGLQRGGGEQVLPTTMAPEKKNRGTSESHDVGASQPRALEAPRDAGKQADRTRVDETRTVEQLPGAASRPAATEPAVTPEQAVAADRPVASEQATEVGQAAAADADRNEVAASKPESDAKPGLTPTESAGPQGVFRAEDKVTPTPARQTKAEEEARAKTLTKKSTGWESPEPAGVATLAQPKPTGELPLAFGQKLTLLIDGKPVVIDAPDSIRIVQDDLGRMIIIYTSDGPIRIRLADDD